MAITERDLRDAEARMEMLREAGHAVSARYDGRRSRIVVALSTGLEINFSPDVAEGLAGASPDDLADIEVSAAGLSLHWPKLDADLSVPGLLRGVFGSKAWMARQRDATETAAEFFRRRAGHASDELGSILARVPDRTPDPGDELP